MRIVDHSATFKAHLLKRSEQLLARVATGAVRDIKSSMANASGGKNPPPGERPEFGWLRQRGKAGGPPARQTGALLQSISWARISWNRVRIGSGLKHAAYQQWGRKKGKDIKPVVYPRLAFRGHLGFVLYRKKVKQVAVPARPWLPTAAKLQGLVERHLG